MIFHLTSNQSAVKVSEKHNGASKDCLKSAFKSQKCLKFHAEKEKHSSSPKESSFAFSQLSPLANERIECVVVARRGNGRIIMCVEGSGKNTNTSSSVVQINCSLT